MSSNVTNITRAEKTVILAVQQLRKNFDSNELNEAAGYVGGVEAV